MLSAAEMGTSSLKRGTVLKSGIACSQRMRYLYSVSADKGAAADRVLRERLDQME